MKPSTRCACAAGVAKPPPDGKAVYTVAEDGMLRGFSLPRGAASFEIKIDPETGGTQPRLAVSSDGRIATAEDSRDHQPGGELTQLDRAKA